MNTNLHTLVFDFVMKFRESNPDFYCALRQRNLKGRLDNGFWFQGNEDYVFLGLYDKGGGSNMTRSFGLVFSDNGGKIRCYIENVFNEENDSQTLSCYQQMRELLGGFEKEKETRYKKYLTEDKGFESATDFLLNEKPKLDKLIKQMGCDDFFYTKERFEKHLTRILKVQNLKKDDILSKSMINIMENKNKTPLNQILYGPPGTGKTYNTINKAVQIVNPSFDIEQDRVFVKEEFNRLVQDGSIRFATFHQSFSYEDFVEGIKPKTIRVVDEKENEKQDIVYEIEDGVFKQLCIAASISKYNWNLLVNTCIGKNRIANVSHEILTIEKPRGGNLLIPIKLIDELVEYIIDNNIDFSSVKQVAYDNTTAKREDYPNLEPYMVNGYENLFPDLVRNIRENIKEKSNQNYVLIIDEINRGNIASIFGELITLIEEDKREGGEEALSTILPYSKEKISVPSNVYILGTMNTADRSVEALDIALRRRFSFIEMAPNTDLLDFDVEDVNVKGLVDVINLRIEKLLDKDHKIGHAYFINVESIDDLIDVFANKVIPLLEEYFFGDYSKIGLVLGRSFVKRVELDSDFSFADFDNDDQSDLLDKPIYELADCADWNFKSIL